MKFRVKAKDLAIDLGSSNILVYKKEDGLLANEASVVALDQNSTEILKFGNEAKDMLGKTPDEVALVKPLEGGVISDFNISEALLNYFFRQINPGFSIVQPKVLITAPYLINDIEGRALEDAALHAGAGDITLINQSLAASYGMGLNPQEAKGFMVVNLGAGVSEACLISLNGIVAGSSIQKGGDYIEREICKYLSNDLGIEVGENESNLIKEKIGSLLSKDSDLSMEVEGRDVRTARPMSLEIGSTQLIPIMINYADDIVKLINEVMEKTPPALSADIIRNGIYFTGGTSLMRGLVDYIQNEINIKCFKSENALTDAINGCGMIVENRNLLKRYK